MDDRQHHSGETRTLKRSHRRARSLAHVARATNASLPDDCGATRRRRMTDFGSRLLCDALTRPGGVCSTHRSVHFRHSPTAASSQIQRKVRNFRAGQATDIHASLARRIAAATSDLRDQRSALSRSSEKVQLALERHDSKRVGDPATRLHDVERRCAGDVVATRAVPLPVVAKTLTLIKSRYLCTRSAGSNSESLE